MDKTKTVAIVAVIAVIVVVAAAAILLLNNNNGGDSNVNRLDDAANDVHVIDGSYPSGTVLEFIKLSGSERDDAVSKTPSSYIDHDTAVAYSILAKHNGEIIQPTVTVEVDVRPMFSETTYAFLISDEATIELIPTMHNGYLTVQAIKLGTFVYGVAPASAASHLVSVNGQNTSVAVNGSAAVNSYSAELAEGTSVTMVATPASGYEFEGYYVNGSLVSSSPSYTFTVGSSDISISAVSKAASAKLTINGGNSTVYVNGESVGRSCEIAFDPSTPVTAYAVADSGYIVSGWSGTYSSSSPVCAFTFVSDASISVQTQTAPKGTSQVHVTTTLVGEVADSYGSILAYGQNVGNEYTATLEEAGVYMTLDATAEAGFVFDHWTIDGETYIASSMNVTAGSDDMEIRAVFVPAPAHSLTATIDNGIVQIDGADVSSKSVKEGLQAVVKAIPADGYKLVGWYIGEKCVSTDAEYTVTMAQSDIALVAKTKNTQHSVSLSVTNGTIEVNGTNVGSSYSGTISEGDTIEFEAVADDTYVFNTWTMNGTVYNANKITVSNASDDITAVASMVKATARTVTVSADYGTVSIDGVTYGSTGSIKSYDGKEVTISVEVPYGYVLRGWTYDNKYVSDEASYTFKTYGDMSFNAVVLSTLHNLTVKAQNGGLIINSANVGSEYSTQLYTGETLIVNAAPSAGNTFSEWDINGKKYGASYQTIEIKMGSEDIVATAYNVPMADGTLHITATNGTVKVGEQDVGDSYDIVAGVGETYTLTAMPSAGYRFDHWMLDGERSDYQIVTVTMGTEHVNAEAVMVKNETHTVTVTIDHGTLVYNSVDVGSKLSIVVEDKSVITIAAKPLTGYALAGWYEGDSLVTISTDHQFQVNADTTLVVKTVVNPVYQ